jgi:hypothetical protein
VAKRNVEPAPKRDPKLRERTKNEPAKSTSIPVFTITSVCTSSEPLIQQGVTFNPNPAK